MTARRKKDPAAVALGKFGRKAKALIGEEPMIALSKKGGSARALSLTPEQRRAIASKAAKARWGKKAKRKTRKQAGA